MGIPGARIPVRSRHQANDWSLVLVSQGIETSIEFAEKGAGWGLVVDVDDYSSALQALHQYQIENRLQPWRRELFGAGILFDCGSLAWVFLSLLFYWLSLDRDFRAVGIMDNLAVRQGQWWRVFTAVWLHADMGHLAANTTLGFMLLGLVMARYGTGAGLLAAYLAGAGGNVTVCIISGGPHSTLGASGMVLGCLGLLTAQSVVPWGRRSRAVKHALGGILGGGMLFVLLGLSPGTDVLAHFGGFATGLSLGSALGLIPGLPRKSTWNLLCGVGFVWLVVLPWFLALEQGAPPPLDAPRQAHGCAGNGSRPL